MFAASQWNLYRSTMFTFFHGWRRKVGVLALVMACMLTGLWIRSESVIDIVWFNIGNRQHCLQASEGQVFLWELDDIAMSASSWTSVDVESAEGLSVLTNNNAAMALAGESSSRRYTRVCYWPLAVPLSLLSVYLILWKPRKQSAHA